MVPKDTTSAILSFDYLATRDLSFMLKAALAQYGTDKLDILTSHFGQAKMDASDKEHLSLTDIQGAKNEYDLLKRLIIQQKFPTESLAVLWQLIFKYY